MTERHYTGGCQCGAVRYAVEVDLDRTVTCNCSRCRRLGAILAFAPAQKFALESGEGAMTEYRFNKHAIGHLFCASCGIQSFSRGTTPDGVDMVAINARCLDHVDVALLTPTPYDGASA
jgi:hypothetical protein